MTGPEQSPTRNSFVGDVGVDDIKIVVTIILILDLINQVTHLWEQIVRNCFKMTTKGPR